MIVCHVLLLLALTQTAADALSCGDEKLALRLFAEELARDPTNRDTLWQYGRLLYGRGQLDRAEELFERSERQSGEHYYSELMLGAIAELRFDYGTALARYRRCLELEPGESQALSGIQRVAEVEADLRRFRAAHARITRDLWILAAALAVLIMIALVFVARR